MYDWGVLFDDWKLGYGHNLYRDYKEVGVTSNYEYYKSHFHWNSVTSEYSFLALLDYKAVKSFRKYVDKRRKSESIVERKKAEKILSELGVIK